MQYRYPTPFGLAVHANFTALETISGRKCVPKPAGRLRGGHCVLACGMDNFDGQWWVKFSTRSWGYTFGDQGCAVLPAGLDFRLSCGRLVCPLYHFFRGVEMKREKIEGLLCVAIVALMAAAALYCQHHETKKVATAKSAAPKSTASVVPEPSPALRPR